MSTSTLSAPSSASSRFKTILWVALGHHRALCLHYLRTAPHHRLPDVPRLPAAGHRRPPSPHPAYALRHDGSLHRSHQVLITIRQRHLKVHRVLGRIYVISVFVGSFTGIALAAGRPGLPGTSMQAAAWMVCTTAAFVTARNRQIIRAPPMDGPFLRRHLYLRLQPCAQPLARVTGATSAMSSPPSA